jgi:hypothetical protein
VALRAVGTHRGRHTRDPQAVSVRGRDGQPYLAGTFIWLLAYRGKRECSSKCPEKRRHEHDVAGETSLEGMGPCMAIEGFQ